MRKSSIARTLDVYTLDISQQNYLGLGDIVFSVLNSVPNPLDLLLHIKEKEPQRRK